MKSTSRGPIHVIVLGRMTYSVPIAESLVDVRVAQELASRLGAPIHSVILADVRNPYQVRVGEVIFHLLPKSTGYFRFLTLCLSIVNEWNKETEGPKVVLGSEVWGNLAAVLSKRIWGTRAVIQVQGEVLSPGPEYGGAFRRYAIRLLSRWSLRNADSARCLNQSIGLKARSLSRTTSILVLGSRVDASKCPKKDWNESTQDNSLRLISVGALIPLKNHALLLEVLQRLSDAVTNVSLTILGEGPSRPSLVRQARSLGVDHLLHLPGRVSNEEVLRELAVADFYLHPSLSEGEPRAVLEAMAVGVPAIVSEIDGHFGLIRDGWSGRVLPALSTSEWTSAILALHFQPARARLFAERARKQVALEHDFHVNLAQFAAFIGDSAQ